VAGGGGGGGVVSRKRFILRITSAFRPTRFRFQIMARGGGETAGRFASGSSYREVLRFFRSRPCLALRNGGIATF